MSDEKRTYSDTQPMCIADLNAALIAHGYPPITIPDEPPTKVDVCPACRDAALALDVNDELPDNGSHEECTLCGGLGAVTAEERRRYYESQER